MTSAVRYFMYIASLVILSNFNAMLWSLAGRTLTLCDGDMGCVRVIFDGMVTSLVLRLPNGHFDDVTLKETLGQTLPGTTTWVFH